MTQTGLAIDGFGKGMALAVPIPVQKVTGL
jgi:hypothetical protein